MQPATFFKGVILLGWFASGPRDVVISEPIAVFGVVHVMTTTGLQTSSSRIPAYQLECQAISTMR